GLNIMRLIQFKYFFFQAEDGIRDRNVTGVQTCALPISGKLEQFLDNIIQAQCYLRVENVENEENKVVELKLNIPGTQLFAKSQAKSFEEATDLAVESIRRQINKYKTKNRVKSSGHKDIDARIEQEF